MTPTVREAQARLRRAFPKEGRPPYADLLTSKRHSPVFTARRAEVILARARLAALILGVITPLWIVADVLLLPWAMAKGLAVARVATGLGLVALSLAFRNAHAMPSARSALALLLLIPAAFGLYADIEVGGMVDWSIAMAMIAAYAMLPFVVAAGLALFPVTALEATLLLVPVIAAKVLGAALSPGGINIAQVAGAVWLLSLVGGAAALAGMIQLRLLARANGASARDLLTGALTRRVGEEVIALAFSQSMREDKPISVVLLDLDDFIAINTALGTKAGDRSLATAARMLERGVRGGDAVIRWGSDEFLLVLPNTTADNAKRLIARLCGGGLGARPIGGTQTASVGIAERRADRALFWERLVATAQKRMARAQKAGKNRIAVDDEAMIEVARARAA